MVSLNGHLRRSNKLCELSDLFAIDFNKTSDKGIYIGYYVPCDNISSDVLEHQATFQLT